MKTPTISVIMSVFNEPEVYLRESIESILNQTFSDFEFIIIIDNPANKLAYKIVQSYASNDNRIKTFLNSENKGLAFSLNRGFSVARGRYIARMDADDISFSQRLEKQLSFIEANPQVLLIGSSIMYIDENKNVLEPNFARSNYEFLKRLIRYGGTPCFHPTWFFRRELLDRIKGYRSLPTSQDYDLLMRVFYLGIKVSNIEDPLLYYRMHPARVSIEKNLYQLKLTRYIIKSVKMDFILDDKRFSPSIINNIIKTSRPASLLHQLSLNLFSAAYKFKKGFRKLVAYFLYFIGSIISPYQLCHVFACFVRFLMVLPIDDYKIKLKYLRFIGKDVITPERKKRKICLLTNTLYAGGTERIVATLSDCLVRNGFDVTIVTLQQGKDYDLNPRVKYVKLSNMDKKSSAVSKVLFFPFKLMKFLAITKRENPHVIISFLERSNTMNALVTFFSKGVSILSTRMNLEEGYRNESPLKRNLIFAMVKIFYNRANLIIAVSEGVRKNLIERFNVRPDKIKVIYNPCDIFMIDKLSKKPLEPQFNSIFACPVITNMGRLAREKGQWHLIRAFKKVREEISEAKLVIIGEGRLRGYLEELIKNLKLENDVHLVGYQKNPFKFIYRSKLFVFSSLWEGFPNSLVEAMACRVPVISSYCESGPQEILSTNGYVPNESKDIKYFEYGILIPKLDGKFRKGDEPLTKSEELLSQAILDMLRNEQKRIKYSERAHKRVTDFALNEITRQWIKILS